MEIYGADDRSAHETREHLKTGNFGVYPVKNFTIRGWKEIPVEPSMVVRTPKAIFLFWKEGGKLKAELIHSKSVERYNIEVLARALNVETLYEGCDILDALRAVLKVYEVDTSNSANWSGAPEQRIVVKILQSNDARVDVIRPLHAISLQNELLVDIEVRSSAGNIRIKSSGGSATGKITVLEE